MNLLMYTSESSKECEFYVDISSLVIVSHVQQALNLSIIMDGHAGYKNLGCI